MQGVGVLMEGWMQEIGAIEDNRVSSVSRMLLFMENASIPEQEREKLVVEALVRMSAVEIFTGVY